LRINEFDDTSPSNAPYKLIGIGNKPRPSELTFFLLGVKTSLMLVAEPDQIEGAIPLSRSEKTCLAELEATIDTGLETFLKVGRALAQIRDRRLYREHYGTFSNYVSSRFNLCRSIADQLIRSSQVAEHLLESGYSLPANVTEAAMRPLTTLPQDNELRESCWEWISCVAPDCPPTSRLVGRVCAVVRECLESDPDENPSESHSSERAGFMHLGPREKKSASEPDAPFIRPLLRMSSYQNFSIDLVISHVDRFESAKSLYEACTIMAERCSACCDVLAQRFPELLGHA
jgi:hypothetical protein